MPLSRRHARYIGSTAIAGVVALQAFNSFACYNHDLSAFLCATAVFVGIPLLPALISLATRNPLRAAGSALLFAPWLIFAHYIDCGRPYSGGGASMIYVAVLLWGTITSLIGALITNAITKNLDIEISDTQLDE